MMNVGHTRALRTALVFAGAFLASACAVTTPATITSTKRAPQSISSVEMLSEAGETGLRARFLDELTEALGTRAVAVQSGADYVADFSVSEREAQLGLQAVPKGNEAAPTNPPADPEFKQRWYHACKPNRVSASLVIYTRTTGTVHAKSSGEFLACPGDLSQIDDLAQILVDRTLGK